MVPYETIGTIRMTKVLKGEKRNGKTYYRLYDQKRVNGKVRSKYIGYIGKDPKAKSEVTYSVVIKYVDRLMSAEIPDSEVHEMLKEIGIDAHITPITKIVLENYRNRQKIFLRVA